MDKLLTINGQLDNAIILLRGIKEFEGSDDELGLADLERFRRLSEEITMTYRYLQSRNGNEM